MRVADLAQHFHSVHSVGKVGLLQNVVLETVEKRRPSTPRVEFLLGVEQLTITDDAVVGPCFGEVGVVLALERGLGVGMLRDLILDVGEFVLEELLGELLAHVYKKETIFNKIESQNDCLNQKLVSYLSFIALLRLRARIAGSGTAMQQSPASPLSEGERHRVPSHSQGQRN